MYKKVIIIDTAVLIHNFKIDADEIYTVEGVINELKSLKSKLVIETYNKKLKILTPSKKIKEEILKKIKNLVHNNLSTTDLDLIACAYELSKNKNLKVIVITDDYSIQNVLKYLKIEIKSVFTKGITKVIKWKSFCKYCYKYFDQEKFCPICGKKLIKVKWKKK